MTQRKSEAKVILYHYVHCPYCVRVRMVLGYLNIPFESVVLPYNDEKTPIELTGKKMLPIMTIGNQSINESIEIIKELDKKNKIKFTKSIDELELITREIGKFVHPLAMPAWIYSKEFDDLSRIYFVNKKEKSKGPFSNLYENRDKYLNDAYSYFMDNKKLFEINSKDALGDQILISSHLYGLYLVPDFSFPESVHKYIQDTREKCKFDYHTDFWS